MHVDDFMRLKQEFDEHENVLLGVKKTEYASDADRLSNFKEVALIEGREPEEYCMTLALKHIHSINKAVKDRNYKWRWASKEGEGLKQRIADVRNYFLLLAALIEEREWNRSIVEGSGGDPD